jgi:hypothetical protein
MARRKDRRGAGRRDTHAALPLRETGLRSGRLGQIVRDAPRSSCPMPALPLAHAFLALADDGAEPRRRSFPMAVVAALAAVTLALGAPLAWLADHPVAALGSKGAAALVDDEAP